MISGQVKKFALTGGVNKNTLLRFVVSILIAPVILLGLASCTSNDDEDNTKDIDNKQVTVTINLSTDTPSTRATITPTWGSGSDDENMKSWIVVIANKSDNKIVNVISNTNNISSGVESDTYTLSLATGDYYFYSFANITATELGNPQKDGTASFDDMTFAVNGNDFDTSDAGIPMSNKQEVSITESTTGIELWVVRMLAKVTLKFKNSTSSDITINSISLSDITENASVKKSNNLMLMPIVTGGTDEVACTPNLNAKDTTCVEYTRIITGGFTVAGNTDYTTEGNSVSFYVNESVAHNPSYFVVTLNTKQGDVESVQRYALFDDWTTIARNDHHILQINLNDYKINFTVQSYTAIGVYPSIEDDGKQLSLTFHLPEEEFHIIPTVTKLSAPNAIVDFTYVEWKSLSSVPEGMFKTAPSWNETLGYIEGVMGGTFGQRDESLYQLQIKIDDNLTLTYKVQINQDLTWYNNTSSGVKDKRTSLPRQWQTVYVSE
ncbi:MAG: hypothetical protein Q4D41_02835 [Prevotellaceae bacterium]|nr:hypothetical protein [Prevotellaceae bacterium]